jgi:cathepsin A (carboxypeptidase C)
LNAGFPALVYTGDVDFICNYLGNQAWTLALEWNYKDDFNTAEPHDWNNGKGLARESNNLTFLQVYDAGHMVPSDQPEASLDMLKTFLSGGAF